MVNIFYLDDDPKKCAQYYCDKHVNKIMIEIAQILSYIHHEIGDKIPPYQKCRAISKSLAPKVWASKSKQNYLYCADLAFYLLQEYKFRTGKNIHKCEEPIIWLRNNIPNFKKNKMTEFKLTTNMQIYSKYFPDPVEATRYFYVDFKCKEDKWTKRGQPDWFSSYMKKSDEGKRQLKEKIMTNVKEKLPKLARKEGLTVYRFHSFLRVIYDELFQDKWDRKIKSLKNMFDPKKPLIDQLGIAHLYESYFISESLFNIDTLNKLNLQSLNFRGKKNMIKRLKNIL